VMLTLARFVLDKTGGDSMPEVRDNLARYRERIARSPAAPVAGATHGGHALVGSDIAGSGGDD
jgi:hypothetical protein